MRQLLLIFISALMLSDYGAAQASSWENYTNMRMINQMLIQNDTCWIATEGGLVKYIIPEFEKQVYKRSNSDIPGNFITSVCLDSNNILWIGTYDAGAASYNGSEWTIYNESNSILPEKVMSVQCDAQGNIWFATRHNGLIKFDGTDWEEYSEENFNFPTSVLNTLHIDTKGSIWAGSYEHGLIMMDSSGKTTEYNTLNSSISSDVIYGISSDQDNNIWIATEQGVSKFNGSEWTVYNTTNSVIQSNQTSCIYIEKGKIVWIGTQGYGIARYDGSNWMKFTKESHGLKDGFVTAICVDNDRMKWIGSLSKGIIKTDFVNNFMPILIANNDLSANNTGKPLIDNDNKVFIPTYYGFTKTDGNYWDMYDSGNSPLPSDEILVMAKDKNNVKYFGTTGGLAVWDDSKGISGWKVYNSENSGLKYNFVTALYVDKNQRIWVATEDNGELESKSGVQYIEGGAFHDIPELNSDSISLSVYAIIEDYTGTFWFGTFGYGLFKYAGGQMTNYNMDNSGFKSFAIYDLEVDKNNTLLIGTGDLGLVTYDGEEFKEYNSGNGALTDYIWDIKVDTTRGCYWLATEGNGLVKFDYSGSESFNTGNSGISSNYTAGIDIDGQGCLWIGTVSGVSFFCPDNPNSADDNLNSKVDISIYPNPSSHFAYIDTMNEIGLNTCVEIFDLLGNKVMKIDPEESNGGRIVINTSLLSPGIYSIIINDGSVIIRRNIVIQR